MLQLYDSQKYLEKKEVLGIQIYGDLVREQRSVDSVV